MSFILDALRKSESERQQEASPNPARAPLARPGSSTPVWIWLVIGAMAAGLAAFSVAWLNNDRTGNTQASAAVNDSEAEAVIEPAVIDTPTSAQTEPEAFNPLSGTPLPISALASADPSLPSYTLELLAYNNADPAAGYAWINGRRYYLGERIANGPELVELRPDSVLLAYRGQTYLLRSR